MNRTVEPNKIMNDIVLDMLKRRRSVTAAKLGSPGPDARVLSEILEIAARVPDHKRLAPWRFLTFQGDTRAAFGAVLERICIEEEVEPPSEMRLETERGRFVRAPVVVAVIANPQIPSVVPEWEQTLSTGAVCLNLCLAANAQGFATSWITEWYAFSPGVAKALHLGENERVAGFIYIGTAREAPSERERPVLSEIVQEWRSEMP